MHTQPSNETASMGAACLKTYMYIMGNACMGDCILTDIHVHVHHGECMHGGLHMHGDCLHAKKSHHYTCPVPSLYLRSVATTSPRSCLSAGFPSTKQCLCLYSHLRWLHTRNKCKQNSTRISVNTAW